MMQYMPGWTVQCLNPECLERGHWLRVQEAPQEICRSCGAPLHNVPPPLAPRFRTRARAMTNYRPMGRRR